MTTKCKYRNQTSVCFLKSYTEKDLQSTEKIAFCNVCAIQIEIGDPKHNGHLVTWKTKEQVSVITDTISKDHCKYCKRTFTLKELITHYEFYIDDLKKVLSDI